ncbi:hypothetical protein ACFVYA_07455 [Amycolatopsis sp. NPDC058278]
MGSTSAATWSRSRVEPSAASTIAARMRSIASPCSRSTARITSSIVPTW